MDDYYSNDLTVPEDHVAFRAFFPYGRELVSGLVDPDFADVVCYTAVTFALALDRVGGMVSPQFPCEGCGTHIGNSRYLDAFPMVAFSSDPDQPAGPSGWWEVPSIEVEGRRSSEEFGQTFAVSRFHDLAQCRARKVGETAYGD